MSEDSPSVSSLYIHIPYCGSKCTYCDFFSLPTAASAASLVVPDEYVEAVLGQLDFFVDLALVERLETVYFGGGTPSLLTCSQLERIMARLEPLLSTGSEVTLEANPESLTKELLETGRRCGVNRVSLGVQSLDDGVLSCVGRRCTASKARQGLQLVAESGIPLCADFIAGLPGQDDGGFLEALDEAVSYRPHHISLYSLTVAEGTRLFRQIEGGQVPWLPEEADRQWILGRDFLERAGYLQYEVSNFAPAGQESRHNSACWRQKPYLGLGAGGAGTLYNFCGDKLLEGFRYTNTTGIRQYIDFWQEKPCPMQVFSDWNRQQAALAARHRSWNQLLAALETMPAESEVLDRQILAFEHLMLGLRMKAGVSGAEYLRRFEKELDERPLDRFVSKGWMEEEVGHDGRPDYRMTSQGLLFLNRILGELV